MLEEIEAERGWDERFARSEGKLADLARRAKAQHASGQTTPLVFDLGTIETDELIINECRPELSGL